MRGQTGKKGFMAQLGGGRAGFSPWRGWLWLWLACALVLPAFTQERPDIVWIRGGHALVVTSVVFSPDGRLLASGSLDHTIKLWRVSDGSLVRTITGHTDWVWSVSFSPDGRLLASGGARSYPNYIGEIKLWRVADGALLQTYDQETGTGVLSIQFSPNGQLFGYGRGDAIVVVARNPFWQRGDVNGDGCVDDADLLDVLSAFGQSDSGLADVNGDGMVDDADLLIVLFNFGNGC
jgi:WD40 repeat protein